ncbi:hypothetical protein SDC9_162988 [bioreactor metagenome]|uniref:Uncharacterized protein n=1 Tax=bioreactor metagenome TaxID=1076179 RepID=A0A645FUI1_9ZZZZ
MFGQLSHFVIYIGDSCRSVEDHFYHRFFGIKGKILFYGHVHFDVVSCIYALSGYESVYAGTLRTQTDIGGYEKVNYSKALQTFSALFKDKFFNFGYFDAVVNKVAGSVSSRHYVSGHSGYRLQ